MWQLFKKLINKLNDKIDGVDRNTHTINVYKDEKGNFTQTPKWKILLRRWIVYLLIIMFLIAVFIFLFHILILAVVILILFLVIKSLLQHNNDDSNDDLRNKK